MRHTEGFWRIYIFCWCMQKTIFFSSFVCKWIYFYIILCVVYHWRKDFYRIPVFLFFTLLTLLLLPRNTRRGSVYFVIFAKNAYFFLQKRPLETENHHSGYIEQHQGHLNSWKQNIHQPNEWANGMRIRKSGCCFFFFFAKIEKKNFVIFSLFICRENASQEIKKGLIPFWNISRLVAVVWTKMYFKTLCDSVRERVSSTFSLFINFRFCVEKIRCVSDHSLADKNVCVFFPLRIHCLDGS